MVIAGPSGGIVLGSSSISGLASSAIKYIDGTLTIASSAASVNASNNEYKYQVL